MCKLEQNNQEVEKKIASQWISGSFFFFFFLISLEIPTAYGHSQASGQIRAVAASLRDSHSSMGSELSL